MTTTERATAAPQDHLKAVQEQSVSAVLADLHTDADGLSTQEAARRLDEHGPNALPEERKSTLVAILSYFWGPIPWMIEVAAVLSAAVRHWDDLVVIMVLLVFNGAVGFWQEHQAADAVEALRRQLALRALARATAPGLRSTPPRSWSATSSASGSATSCRPT